MPPTPRVADDEYIEDGSEIGTPAHKVFHGVLRKGFTMVVGYKAGKPIIAKGDGKKSVPLDRENAIANMHKFDNTAAIRKHFGLPPIKDYTKPDIERPTPRASGISEKDVRAIVKESVGAELEGVHKAIGDLAKAVDKLSKKAR